MKEELPLTAWVMLLKFRAVLLTCCLELVPALFWSCDDPLTPLLSIVIETSIESSKIRSLLRRFLWCNILSTILPPAPFLVNSYEEKL